MNVLNVPPLSLSLSLSRVFRIDLTSDDDDDDDELVIVRAGPGVRGTVPTAVSTRRRRSLVHVPQSTRTAGNERAALPACDEIDIVSIA